MSKSGQEKRGDAGRQSELDKSNGRGKKCISDVGEDEMEEGEAAPELGSAWPGPPVTPGSNRQKGT